MWKKRWRLLQYSLATMGA
ncbi:BnaC08g10910D [Brassica napus]|uniref:BnaC08g10910D protein n=1 Tax=Brassica napus TaxID=3708 RepID=A0A078I023_BRANA|nr:BnaC08g10910D [Brassica napus]